MCLWFDKPSMVLLRKRYLLYGRSWKLATSNAQIVNAKHETDIVG